MEQQLIKLIKAVPELMDTAKECNNIKLPNYYVAGGAITQLIWNDLLGRKPLDQVKDLDIVYFDTTSCKSEQWYESNIASRLKHDIAIDVKNQARVHEWYPRKFGQVITPYDRVEQGISSWLSAFAIGFRLNTLGEPEIYSTSGLAGAFQMKVKPNKIAMTEASYLKMTQSFKERWPSISVEPWDSAC
ncbi:nucleotidyltransferase family protein [Photobacterium kasasachensis]|uniref:nucleotidyltransferase family protein n=1 Tax=Photobacterium kasasachensis TaxID=2910240 RepID=UPI003D0D5A2B